MDGQGFALGTEGIVRLSRVLAARKGPPLSVDARWELPSSMLETDHPRAEPLDTITPAAAPRLGQ